MLPRVTSDIVRRIRPEAKLVAAAGLGLGAFAAAFGVGQVTAAYLQPAAPWIDQHRGWVFGSVLAAVIAMALVVRRTRNPPARRMMPLILNVMLVVLVGVAAFAVAATVIWLALGQPDLPRERQLDINSSVDLIKLGLTVAAGLGGVIALVVAYRRQRVTEQENARAEEESVRSRMRDERESTKFVTERFATASTLLGHEAAAVRLSGVYAVGALADDWPEQRQACIDVLCAYLRMPYESDPALPGFRQGEREVRLSITRVIRDHLRIDASTPWFGNSFDFTGAVFDGGDFSQILVRDRMDFRGARFVAGFVDFRDVTFGGGTVDLTEAEFSGGTLD
ncbi:MAG TPA: pentapeptide repeat-containing protein, partial [Pilimelia sp.]|nr:pentapeptide repeat-containing protein [Pilimelia sp.]